MDKLRENRARIKGLVSVIFTLIFVVFAVFELHHLDYGEYRRLFLGLTYLERWAVVLLGLGAFLFCTLYDFVLADFFALEVPKKEIFKAGWIAQSFNNFISFGGATGVKMRSSCYRRFSVTGQVPLKISLSVVVSGTLGLYVLVAPALYFLRPLPNPLMYLLGLFFLYPPAFFFLGRVKLPFFRDTMDETSPFHFLTTEVKGKILLVSLVDWIVVALYFCYLVGMVKPEIPFLTVFSVYIVAELIGLLSFIPGGLGSFDLTVLLLFRSGGFGSDWVLVPLIMFRLGYLLLPWLFGVALLVVPFFRGEKARAFYSREILRDVTSGMVFLAGILLILSAATPAVTERFHFLSQVVSHNVLILSKQLCLAMGVLLVIMSRGLRLGLRRVYRMSLAFMVLAGVFCILKGLDYEEALVLFLFSLFLYGTRSLYSKESRTATLKQISQIIPVLLLSLTGYVFLHNLTHKVNIYTSHEAYSLLWIGENPGRVLLFFLFLTFFLTLLFFSKSKAMEFHPPGEEDIAEFQAFIQKYPGNKFTHLYYLLDKDLFYNEKHTVMIQYRPQGQNLLVLGDPIGDPEDFEDAVDEFMEFAEDRDMEVAIYEAGGDHLEIYADQGLSFLKLGEEATVDLINWNYEGSKKRTLRNFHNRMIREGYQFQVVEPPLSPDLLEELRKISDHWLGGRREMGYSLGFFREDYLNRAPVAILRNPQGELRAFASLMVLPGCPVISIDLMRQLRGKGSSNEMDFLFLFLFDWAKEAGYEGFYLGVAPLSEVGGKRYSGPKEKIMNMVYQYGNKIYSFRGLRSYKEKFHPKWEGVYLVYPGDRLLPEIFFNLYDLVHYKTDTKER